MLGSMGILPVFGYRTMLGSMGILPVFGYRTLRKCRIYRKPIDGGRWDHSPTDRRRWA